MQQYKRTIQLAVEWRGYKPFIWFGSLVQCGQWLGSGELLAAFIKGEGEGKGRKDREGRE